MTTTNDRERRICEGCWHEREIHAFNDGSGSCYAEDCACDAFVETLPTPVVCTCVPDAGCPAHGVGAYLDGDATAGKHSPLSDAAQPFSEPTRAPIETTGAWECGLCGEEYVGRLQECPRCNPVADAAREAEPYCWAVEYRDAVDGPIRRWERRYWTRHEAESVWAHTTRPWHRIFPLFERSGEQ